MDSQVHNMPMNNDNDNDNDYSAHIVVYIWFEILNEVSVAF